MLLVQHRTRGSESMRQMASIVCAVQSDISAALHKIEVSDVNGYHLDIVDTDFDEEGRIKSDLYRNICRNSKKMKEMHLLTEKPRNHIGSICSLLPDLIYVSAECTDKEEIYEITENAGVSLGLYIESHSLLQEAKLEEWLKYTDHFMVLTVTPRSIGSNWLAFAEQNIDTLLRFHASIEIELDGACSPEVIQKYSKMGIEAFVLGTKSRFFDEFRVMAGRF